MVDYRKPTLSLFQDDNIKKIENCYIIKQYKLNNKNYALFLIEVIDKRKPDVLLQFTVDVGVYEDDIYIVSQYISISDGKSTPKLLKLEWGDKKVIKDTIIKQNKSEVFSSWYYFKKN